MSKKRGLAWAFSKHVTMQEAWDLFSEDEYLQFSATWLGEVCRVVKPNGNLLIFGTYHNIYLLGFLLQKMDRRILNSIIWAKPNAQPNITCRLLTESTEQIIWACNESQKKASKWTFNYEVGKTFNDGKQLRNFWHIPVTPRSERVADHPTQKPFTILERMILLFTQEGQTVLDPFAGAGTTGAAAIKHGRKTYLIERDEKFYQGILRRLEIDNTADDLEPESSPLKTEAKENENKSGMEDPEKSPGTST